MSHVDLLGSVSAVDDAREKKIINHFGNKGCGLTYK
jgi:hypothetical protein